MCRTCVGQHFGGGACKAIDKVLRELMNISEEQAEADAKKVKAMRTAVGWFSSPACAVIYQVAKYVAAFSSKKGMPLERSSLSGSQRSYM